MGTLTTESLLRSVCVTACGLRFANGAITCASAPATRGSRQCTGHVCLQARHQQCRVAVVVVVSRFFSCRTATLLRFRTGLGPATENHAWPTNRDAKWQALAWRTKGEGVRYAVQRRSKRIVFLTATSVRSFVISALISKKARSLDCAKVIAESARGSENPGPSDGTFR